MAQQQPPPEVIALLPASVVHQDPMSGIYSVFSVMLNVRPAEYPINFPVLFVYIELTNGRGDTPLQLRIVDVDEARPPVLDLSMTLYFPSPIHVIQAKVAKHDVTFPMAGDYRLQLFSAGQILKERRLFLQDPPPSG